MELDRLTRPHRPRAIILVPSKELAVQVEGVAKQISHYAKLKIVALCNSKKYKYERKALIDGVDIVISTPDRLERHREKENLYLSLVNFFVIDECDTFIDSGFKEVIQAYINILKNRQELEKGFSVVPKALFVSATVTRNLQGMLERNFGEKNINFLVEKKTHMNLHNITHEFIHCTSLDKKEPLIQLMGEVQRSIEKKDGSVMIFCNSIPSCQSLIYTLQENGYSAVALHGDIPKNLRVQQFNRFKDRQERILVCTDLGSRGLDFPWLSHVINFDFPKTTSDYLHRVGRTGRAGKKGTAISLYHSKDNVIIKELQKSHESNIPLNIQGSQYSKINKEVLKSFKRQEVEGEGSYKELKQKLKLENNQNNKNFSRNKYLLPDSNKSLVPESYAIFKERWLKTSEARSQLKNYIPEKNKYKDELSELRKQKKRIKKQYRLKLGKQTKKRDHRMRYLRRMIAGENQQLDRQKNRERKQVKKMYQKRQRYGLN